MSELLINLLKEALLIFNAESECDPQIIYDYSGRGMMGKTCLGIGYEVSTIACYSDLINCILSVAEIEQAVIIIMHLKYARSDSLGKGQIMYWPNIQIAK